MNEQDWTDKIKISWIEHFMTEPQTAIFYNPQTFTLERGFNAYLDIFAMQLMTALGVETIPTFNNTEILMQLTWMFIGLS